MRQTKENLIIRNEELNQRLIELEAKLKDKEQSLKYTWQREDKLCDQIKQADSLLTALGVPENEKKEDYTNNYEIATRIALLINMFRKGE